MPLPLLIPLALGGASFLGGLFKKKSTQESTSSTSTALDPAYKGLQDMVLNQVRQRLASGSPDLSGYAGSGVANINRTYDLVGQNLDNSLTARGLADSPVAGSAAMKLNLGRGSEIAGFQNSLPLLMDQLRRQNLFDASGVLAGAPRTTTTTGSGTTTNGGGVGGAFENLAAMLGYLSGQGMFGRSGNGLPGYTWPPQ